MNTLKTIQTAGLLAFFILGFALAENAVAQPGSSLPVESFYNELAPYGQWMQYPGYGNVWQPRAEPDFQPYASGGHWVVTEYGNTWVSDYTWGWAPFHYGRWLFDPAYGGWLWLPGSDWGPAWVSWRSGGGYYGWAPLGPGVNINVNVNIPAPYWTFVPQVYITSPRLYSYRVPRPSVINIYQNTTIINNVYRSNNRAYVYGPQRVEIERVTRQQVPVYRINSLNRPGRSVAANGSVGFYQPNAAAGYGRSYGSQDRFENNRTNGGNRASAQPYGTPAGDRRGNYANGAADPEGRNPALNRTDRIESGRGAYSPDANATPNVYPQQSGRWAGRPDRSAVMENLPTNGSRPTDYGSRPNSRRSAYPQRTQESGRRTSADQGDYQRDGSRSGGRQRGPR